MAMTTLDNKFAYLLPTLMRLGLGNVTTVALYRMALRSRLAEWMMAPGAGYGGPFFSCVPERVEMPEGLSPSAEVVDAAEALLEGYLTYFSHRRLHSGSPPDWFLNPVEGKWFNDCRRHWSRIADFDPGSGDIKTVWEASRFDWAILLARACRLTGDVRFLDALNNWIGDWTRQNPLNLGPNWKCGQEAGIRMQQLLLTAFLLCQHKTPHAGLLRFVTEHCRRIEPTLRYAMAQDNNHGTSEAAALFVAGAWLATVGDKSDLQGQGELWQAEGRRWLENRLGRLVAEDGSFSQYSFNYHRVLVDTLNIVEFWRRELGQETFSERFYGKARAAVEWLYQLTDPLSGDGPNVGANDGARLFVLSSTDYRDYRPSVQLGAVLFLGHKVYAPGPWDEALLWLGLREEGGDERLLDRPAKDFPAGGFALIRPREPGRAQTLGVVRCPNFRFRPGHNDALHFDLWHAGDNILRDTGTYSYSAGEPWQSYFGSARAHNTVQFDNGDQMPRIGRFLQGAWLRMEPLAANGGKRQGHAWSGAYTDYRGCHHRRTIDATGNHWRIIDEIEGFRSVAVLRWYLMPGRWRLQGRRCAGEKAEIEISCNRSLEPLILATGWESRYYLEKSELPVLEIQVKSGPAILTTDIHLKECPEA